MSKTVNLQRLSKLQTIFTRNNWPLDSNSEFFNDFCRMLPRLTDAQQDLVICLTEDFLWVSEGQYRELFYQAFDKFIENHPFRENPRIILAPLLAPKDADKSKSSKFLHYLISPNFPTRKYASYNVRFIDNNLAVAKAAKPDDKICLIDDFVGAGSQAHDAILDLEQKGVDRKNISIVTLVVQNIGYKHCLENENVHVYFAHFRERGISDNPLNRTERTKLMEEIEEIVSPPEGYNFGKDRTEALVKMNRTPNNTFPVFWYTNSDRFPFAPFPRMKHGR